jgi:hypothetical protein
MGVGWKKLVRTAPSILCQVSASGLCEAKTSITLSSLGISADPARWRAWRIGAKKEVTLEAQIRATALGSMVAELRILSGDESPDELDAILGDSTGKVLENCLQARSDCQVQQLLET